MKGAVPNHPGLTFRRGTDGRAGAAELGRRHLARTLVREYPSDAHSMIGMYVTSSSSGLYSNVFYGAPRTFSIAIGTNF